MEVNDCLQLYQVAGVWFWYQEHGNCYSGNLVDALCSLYARANKKQQTVIVVISLVLDSLDRLASNPDIRIV